MPEYREKLTREDFGWHSRGYLPHFDGGNDVAQFVTFRLSDSMPQTVLEEWLWQGYEDAKFRKKIESYLDAGYGACWLGQDGVAKIVSTL